MIKQLLGLVLFLCAGVLPLRAAYIYGRFTHLTTDAKLELWVPHYYLDGKNSTYPASLNPDGQFSIEAKVPEPQLAFLIHGDDRLPVFLAPDDTLLVQADAYQFPLVVVFGAKGGGNNTVLAQYLRESGVDFNEFNNLRYKIGDWWASIEEPISKRMEEIGAADWRAEIDKRRLSATVLTERFAAENPGALTPAFQRWMEAEILYAWAYDLLFYGHMYGGRHFVQADFFDFLDEAPIINSEIGNGRYRDFVFLWLARAQVRSGTQENFWVGMYRRAGELLADKSLAYARAEIIEQGFQAEVYKELLPIYNDYLKNNSFAAFDPKVVDLYAKLAPVMPGTPAPEFGATDIGGNGVALSNFRGRIVYLNFWASWCGSCIRKMEVLEQYSSEFERQGIAVVHVSIDQNAESWRARVALDGFKGTHLLASGGQGKNLATLFGVEAVPQYFLLDKSGKFADKAGAAQPEQIRNRLLELAAEK